ncbi:hypothetical protein AB833_24820 [Chromatiales bacterium (ex Bugula neritina AB1)]|nr:hypothetical protein AB833_24820 [Chromatiales bacterium (ex Bugula neritina AB1)]
MRISMMMAMDTNKLIGKQGGMPWHISTELKYFKKVTMGKPVIMGRVTHESIGRPLPGRVNIVVTRNQDWQVDGLETVASLDDAFAFARTCDAEEMMVIGGASLCAAAMPATERLYLTVIDHEFADGDTWLNSFDWQEWSETSSESHDETADCGYRYTYYVLDRKP